jgi:HAD superfamily hydrolase (TIGR01509 family)
LYKEYRELIVECYSKNAIFFPNALEVLQRLKIKGIKLALVTSATSAFIKPFNQRANFDKLFDVIVTHVEGEETKPSPAIYKRALECLNIVPEVAIAVEDSKNGVLSAHAANIYVVQFRGGNSDVSKSPKLENASYAVKSWLELEEFCMRILNG